MNSKAQLKIQEMAFMIVAIILFFILVGLFAVSIVYKNLQESATGIAEDRTLAVITNLAGTAEFICPDTKSNCIDADKLMALKSKDSYRDFWSFSSLSVIRYSGFSKNEDEMIECKLSNYPNCDVIRVHGSEIKGNIHSFVALCRREYENNNGYEKCEIAQLWAGS